MFSVPKKVELSNNTSDDYKKHYTSGEIIGKKWYINNSFIEKTKKSEIYKTLHIKDAVNYYSFEKGNNDIKIMKIYLGIRMKERYFAEKNCLINLKHKNIIKIIDSYNDDKFYCIVCEQMYNDLLNILNTRLINTTNKVYIMKEILEGIIYMHSNSYYHGDLKLENILVSKDLVNIKICDYEYATKKKTIEGLKGTVLYLPLNIKSKKNIDTEKKDIWEYGMCCYYLFIGTEAYNENDYWKLPGTTVYKMLLKSIAKYPLSNNIKIFLKDILRFESSERLTAIEIYDKYFSKGQLYF